MFVQIITGRTTDPDGLRRQFDRWVEELRPGAVGFLGSTGGITPDGRFITLARFADEAAARANSDRPEQTAWWNETEKYLEGAEFAESTDVESMLGGGSDQAGFVQVMQGQVRDRAKMDALTATMTARLPALRPDLLGSTTVWLPGGRYADVAYFTSEADARAGEAKPLPDDIAALMSEWQAIAGEITYLDLTEPWLVS